MNNFSSFFEFLSALNSAYVVSNHFLESLITKINSNFTDLNKKLQSIKQIYKNGEEELKKESESCTVVNGADEVVRKLFEENNDISTRIGELEEEISDCIEQNSVSSNFNLLCLFGAIYCIIILLLIGLSINFSNILESQLFFLFNMLNAILLCIILVEKEVTIFKLRLLKKITPTYTHIVKMILISIFLVYLTYWVETVALKKHFFLFSFKYNFQNFNTVIAILLPSFHFIYYYIVSNTKIKRKSKEISQNLNLVKNDCEQFALKLKTQFDVVKTIQKKS